MPPYEERHSGHRVPLPEPGLGGDPSRARASCDDSDVTGPIPAAARSHDVLPLTVECWIGTTGQVTVTRDTRLSVLGKVRQGQNAVLSATVM